MNQLSDTQLHAIMQDNRTVVAMLSRYLNYHSRFLDEQTVLNFAKECHLDTETAFSALFCAACGLDSAENREHRRLEQTYFKTGVRRQDPVIYRNDPYYQKIRFPDVTSGRWKLCTKEYLPFEPFVRTHPTVTEDLREIPQIAYFTEAFPFPAVLENDVEWMTVTPNEIETMREPIERSHGNVLTLGLGLGYFAFCAAQKDSVISVTVIERDADVIKLFETYILPQFSNREKIRILQDDAFHYLQTELPKSHYDYLFADLWHDASDGLEMYMRLKRILTAHSDLPTDYWIEPSLLSALRHIVYDKLTDPRTPLQLRGVSMAEFLSDDFLKKLSPDLREE